MIKIKSQEEIDLMREAGRITRDTLKVVENSIRVGISTKELDKIAYDYIKSQGATPSFKNYGGFPGSICASVNDTIVHGIPSNNIILKEGDIISIDVGATYAGMVGDGAWTYPVGKISEEKQKLLKVTEEALFAGIEQMKPGNVLDDISSAIEAVANREKYGIVRQYGGHGVGHTMHEDPFLYNYSVGDKTLIKSGYVIAIEPMINLGCDDVESLSDGWTVQTKDKKASAHFEHTVLATDDGPELMTIIREEFL